MSRPVHAGCVARLTPQGWAAVLITGPSGAGKSDLTLRLLERGWSLVADDRVQLWASGGRLYARAPRTLDGLIEARGLGVMGVTRRTVAEVRLLVELAPAGQAVERVPERRAGALAGVAVESVTLRALEASAPAKAAQALRRAMRDAMSF